MRTTVQLQVVLVDIQRCEFHFEKKKKFKGLADILMEGNLANVLNFEFQP